MIEKTNIPIGKIGDYEIIKSSPTKQEAFISNIRAPYRPIYEGEIITALKYHNKIIMSDTQGEMSEMWNIINEAHGHVLIVGLGLGIILREIAKKKEVKKITVIEISREIIDLVWPNYIGKFGRKTEIIKADIFNWKPDKKAFYNIAYYDIWNNFCSDNLEEMKKLHRKFAKKTGYQESWGRYQCEQLRRKEAIKMTPATFFELLRR